VAWEFEPGYKTNAQGTERLRRKRGRLTGIDFSRGVFRQKELHAEKRAA
jgi:hypothetical protein